MNRYDYKIKWGYFCLVLAMASVVLAITLGVITGNTTVVAGVITIGWIGTMLILGIGDLIITLATPNPFRQI